jgi:hypothetical protein
MRVVMPIEFEMRVRASVAASRSLVRVKSFVSEFQDYSVPTVGTGALIVLFVEAAATVAVKDYFDSLNDGIGEASVPVAAVILFAVLSGVAMIGLVRDLWRSRSHADAFRPPAYCAMIGHASIVLYSLFALLSRLSAG